MTESAFFNVFVLTVISAVTVVGVMGNGFITIVNCLEWIQNKTLSPSDTILIALSIIRLFYLGTTLGIYSSSLLDIGHPSPVPTFILYLWSFLNAASLWVATCLAVFYCMKIINFTQPFLVKMKMRISGMIPQLLLGSVLASLIVSLPYIWFNVSYHCCNATMVLLDNSNGSCPHLILSHEFSAVVYIVGTSPSFVIFLVSSALLIRSLLQHVKKMKQSTESFRDQRMEIHVNAIKNLILFLILYSANYAAEIIVTLFRSPSLTRIAIILVATYHSGHPLILIVMNSKLKEALLKTSRLCLRKTMSSSSLDVSKETGCF